MAWRVHLGRMRDRVRRLAWRLAGGRRVRLFGQDLRFVPETEFIDRPLRLPREGPTSQITRYADSVQMHAVCRFLLQCPDRPVVVDVGAHHGVYAVLLGKMVEPRGGRVLAVEPHPASFAILSRNVRLNRLERVVHAEPAALLDREGDVDLDPAGSETRLVPGRVDGGLRVRATTLASLLAAQGVGRVDLLVIDVEGAELPVLAGYPWPAGAPGRIFCEMHPYAWEAFGYGGRDVQAFLREHGYRCFDMYMNEHTVFEDGPYLGPCLLVPANLDSKEPGSSP